jgi:hypothetical protein
VSVSASASAVVLPDVSNWIERVSSLFVGESHTMEPMSDAPVG